MHAIQNYNVYRHPSPRRGIYYGRFLNEQNDVIIHEILNRKTPKKHKLETQNSTNENVIVIYSIHLSDVAMSTSFLMRAIQNYFIISD